MGCRSKKIWILAQKTAFLAQISIFLRYAQITQLFRLRRTQLIGIISSPWPQVTLDTFRFPVGAQLLDGPCKCLFSIYVFPCAEMFFFSIGHIVKNGPIFRNKIFLGPDLPRTAAKCLAISFCMYNLHTGSPAFVTCGNHQAKTCDECPQVK